MNKIEFIQKITQTQLVYDTVFDKETDILTIEYGEPGNIILIRLYNNNKLTTKVLVNGFPYTSYKQALEHVLQWTAI